MIKIDNNAGTLHARKGSIAMLPLLCTTIFFFWGNIKHIYAGYSDAR